MESLRNRNNSPISPEKTLEIKPKSKSIFMFVNPISGSREGVAYTELPSMVYDYILEDMTEITLSITNLLEKESVEATKKDIESTLESHIDKDPRDVNSVFVLLCGGDGTFMNMAQELKNFGIDINTLRFVVFPFGTANDIARSFGWGSTPSYKMLHDLKLI